MNVIPFGCAQTARPVFGHQPAVTFSGRSNKTPDDAFQGNDPLEFIRNLPWDISAPGKGWVKVKAVLSRQLDQSGPIDKLKLAQDRLPEHLLAKGKLHAFLKASVENIERNVSERSEYFTLDRGYFDLGRACLSLAYEQKWVRSATDKQIKNKAESGRFGAVAAVYPGPVYTRTEAYYTALRDTKLDFEKIGQDLYEAGMKIYKPFPSDPDVVARMPHATYANEAQIHSQFGHQDAAIEALKRGVAEVTGFSQRGLRHSLAEQYERVGRYQEAVEQRELILADAQAQQDTEKPDPYLHKKLFEVAVPYFEMGDLEKALEYARKAHDLQPDGRHYRHHEKNRYGDTYADFLGRILIAKAEKDAQS